MSLNELRPPEGSPPEPVMLPTLFDEAVEVRRLAFRPGDVIVLSVEHGVTRDGAHDMRRMLEEWFPDHRCIVLGPGIDIGVMGPE